MKDIQFDLINLDKVFSRSHLKLILFIITLIFLTACSTTPPKKINNLCSIFTEKPSWYRMAKKSQKKWGTPIQIQMAIMRQESAFRSDVRPPRPYLLFIIPWFRKSSAYGYAQAQDAVWSEYLDEVGGWFKSRDDFEDAIDFIGWYTYKTRQVNKVSLWRADLLYLNYHEGWGGYRRKTYKHKAWLMKVANKVKKRASLYAGHLKKCNL